MIWLGESGVSGMRLTTTKRKKFQEKLKMNSEEPESIHHSTLGDVSSIVDASKASATPSVKRQ